MVTAPVLLYVAGGQLLRRRAAADPGARIHRSPAPLDITERPDWISQEDIRDINRVGRGVEGRSIYDPELARTLAAHYQAQPWVSHVNYVRRRYPDHLDVSLEIRQPFARVRIGRRRYRVDAAGVRLPDREALRGTRDPIEERSRGGALPVITGLPAGTRAPQPGTKWDAPGLSDAIAVLQAAKGMLDTSITRVAIEDRRRVRSGRRSINGPSRIVLYIDGVPYHWGEYHAQEATPYGLLSTSAKLENLALARQALTANPDRRVALVRLNTRRREPTLEY